MTMLELKLPAGIYRNGTRYDAKGRWYDAQLVRFFEGTKRPVGGWEVLIGSSLYVGQSAGSVWSFSDTIAEQQGIWSAAATDGIASVDNNILATPVVLVTRDDLFASNGAVPRALLAWWNNSIAGHLAIGTNKSIVVFVQGVIKDISPAGLVAGGVDSVTVAGQFGAGAFGAGNFGEGDIAQASSVEAVSWQLDTFGDYLVGVLKGDGRALYWDGLTNTMVEMGAHAVGTLTIGPAVPTAADTVTIGSTVYTWRAAVGATANEVKIGGTIAISATNLKLAINAGPTGSGTLWGSSTVAHPTVTATATATTVVATAIAAGSGGNAIVTTEAGTNTLFGAATLLGGDSAPINNVGIVVTNERFVVLLGAGGNPRLVQWLDRESLTIVTAKETNAAGNYTLPGSGQIMCGLRAPQETLIWTDDSLFSMQYMGGPLVYSITEHGSKCGIISRHAAVIVGDRAIWMGLRGFWQYDGFARPLSSTVSDYVFADFNKTQRAKCFAAPMTSFGEVWFYYPSSLAMEPDRYVIYNYIENHWSIGRQSRTAGIDRSIFEFPTFADTVAIYQHERGTNHVGADAPALESGPIELGSGDHVMDILGLIPDESTRAGQKLGSTAATLYTSMNPDTDETANGPYTLASRTDIRLSGRIARLRLAEVSAGDWRVGTVKLDVQAGSQR